MKLSNRLSEKQLLTIGLVGALITVLGGELPIGWYTMPETDDIFTAQLMGYGSVSTIQLAFGVFFGAIGIALQAFGFEALSHITGKDGQNPKTSGLIHIGALACGFLGPVVHILCIALMYVCRGNDMDEIIRWFLYIVAPVSIVFMPVYMAMMIALFIAVIRGKTILPGYSAFFNPAIIMMIVNIAALLCGNNKAANALQMANMGIGSLITFAGILLVYNRINRTADA